MPTLLDVSGAKYPKEFNNEKLTPIEGMSLSPHFKGILKSKERVLCFDHFDSSAIRKGGWKLVRGNNRYKNRTWELYNLDEDRCETNNLIAANPGKAKELEAEWLAWAKRVKVNPYYLHKQVNPFQVISKLNRDAQGFYLLKHGDQVPREHAPIFSQKSIEVKLLVTRGKERNGVLISHGGSRSGYSLYLEDGIPVFSCRLDGVLYTYRATQILPGNRISLSLIVNPAGQVSLNFEEEILIEGKLPSLLKNHPQDPLEIGNDSLSTVGDYHINPRFKGFIHQAKLKLK
jgi:arylsulfatase